MRVATLLVLLTSCSLITDPGSYEEGPEPGTDAGSRDADVEEDAGPDGDAGPEEDVDSGVSVDAGTSTTCDTAFDCAEGFVCNIELGVCVTGSCDCDDDEVCIFTGASSEMRACIRCDANGDGLRSCAPECSTGADDCDCDDDDDGAEHPACDPVLRDCDDSDPAVRPGLLACDAPAARRACQASDPAPGIRATRVSFPLETSVPVPPDTPDMRVPVSIVITGADTYRVYFPSGGSSGADPFSDVIVRQYEVSATAVDELENTLAVSELSDVRGFNYLVARRSTRRDSPGVFLGLMGTDDDRNQAVWIFEHECGAGPPVCNVLKQTPSTSEASFAPPLDLAFAPPDAASALEPRLYWIEDQPAGGFSRRRVMRMESENRSATISPLVGHNWPAGGGLDIAAYGPGVVSEGSASGGTDRYLLWFSPPVTDDVVVPGCTLADGCLAVPFGPGAPALFGGIPGPTPAGPPAVVSFGVELTSDAATFFPGGSGLWVHASKLGCDEAEDCPVLTPVTSVSDFTLQDATTIYIGPPGGGDDLVAVAWDRAAPDSTREPMVSILSVADIQGSTDGTAVEPLETIALGDERAALDSIVGIDIDAVAGPEGTELAILVMGRGAREPVSWIHALRFCDMR